MIAIEPSIEFRWMTPDPLRAIESAARICYKSEDRSSPERLRDFVKTLLRNGHTSMIEHASMSYKAVCDRGVSHAIVRHRLFSYAQESTQYCNYAKKGGITVVRPVLLSPEHEARWTAHVTAAEELYLGMVGEGARPETARSALPTCLKTELVITGNFTEWRHFFRLRCAKNDQAQIQRTANMILEDAKRRVGVVFDDLPGEQKSWH